MIICIHCNICLTNLHFFQLFIILIFLKRDTGGSALKHSVLTASTPDNFNTPNGLNSLSAASIKNTLASQSQMTAKNSLSAACPFHSQLTKAHLTLQHIQHPLWRQLG